MLMPNPFDTRIKPSKVLLLEDSDHGSGLIYQALRRVGFDVRHRRITSSAELIAEMDDDNWDAVVSQFQMAELDGLDALRIVRSTGQDIPFIFVCETVGEAAIVPAVKAGANDCIVKTRLPQLGPALAHEIAHSAERAKYKMVHENRILQDNVARQCLEGRLLEGEQAWRLLFDKNPVAQMLQLPFSTVTSVNDRLIELSGYERSELVGRTAEETGLRVDDDLGRRFIEIMKAKGHADELEMHLRRKDGTVRLVIISSRSVKLNGTLYRLHSFVDITDKRLAEVTARLSQQAIATVSQGILITGADRLTLSVNSAFETITGYAQKELVGRSCAILQGPKTSSETVLQIQRTLESGEPFSGEILNYRKDGSTFWNELSINPVFDADGHPSHYVGVLRDVTKLKAQQAQLKLAAQIFTQGSESVVVADESGLIVMVNQAFTKISGYDLSEVHGQNLRILSSERQNEDFFSAMLEAVHAKGSWQGEIWRLRKDGTEYAEWLTMSVVRNELGAVCNYVCTSSDTSEQRAAVAQISRLSHFDSLTGLPNRTLLADRCAHDISIAQREGRLITMMVLGLDRFKNINDALGHPYGDEVLKQLAARLTGALRGQDSVARTGGDEFILVLPGSTHDGADLLAVKLLHVVAQPFVVNNFEVSITGSIGIAIFPSDGLDFETLLKSSEVAMHQAKELGGGRHRFFSSEMFETAKAEMALVGALRSAIAKDQLSLHYQPFVDLRTGQIGGMEALLRWNHPDLGFVSPAQFIPIAEQFGLIVDIGNWVLRRACRDIRDWLDRGIDVPQVSINVSPVQFRDPELLDDITAALHEFAIEPRLISLEVTEGALMDDVKRSETLLHSLKTLGVNLALDDFGTGYSSLSYLKLFPFDKVKIDQSFVRGISNSSQDAVIVKVVISMAHGLGLRVVAEGVESEAQFEFMRANMCDEIQGYFFSKPVRMEEMEAMMVGGHRIPAYLMEAKKKTRTLLLVDDDRPVIASLKRLFRNEGYQLISAASGPEGLEILTRSPVDVVVSDQHIPGMTGVEFLRRSEALSPDTVRIMLSGMTELTAVTEAINAGVIHRFLTKPWDGEQLRHVIKESFDHKALADENRQLNMRILATDKELELRAANAANGLE